MPIFTPGQTYNRKREIHDVFGGQRQGGISTPKDHPYVFLFTGESGDAYGYHDRFRSDGIFLYTGEGQKDDMEFVRGISAIKDHKINGKRLALFEEAKKNGDVRFVGFADCVGFHFEDRPDVDENLRRAIIFELDVETGLNESPSVSKNLPDESATKILPREAKKRTLSELRDIALASSASVSNPKSRRIIVHNRSIAVRTYVLLRASGRCEGCELSAPFVNRSGEPYLEPHHTLRVADGGPDHPDHVIALCPTCHRKVHFGRDGESYNEQLITRLLSIGQGDI